MESKKQNKGFPGDLVVKNLPANAGDKGSIPGLGKSHMPWSNSAYVPQLLSLCSRVRPLQWEGGLRGREQIYTYGWLMLMYGGKQNNIAKQLSSN